MATACHLGGSRWLRVIDKKMVEIDLDSKVVSVDGVTERCDRLLQALGSRQCETFHYLCRRIVAVMLNHFKQSDEVLESRCRDEDLEFSTGGVIDCDTSGFFTYLGDLKINLYHDRTLGALVQCADGTRFPLSATPLMVLMADTECPASQKVKSILEYILFGDFRSEFEKIF